MEFSDIFSDIYLFFVKQIGSRYFLFAGIGFFLFYVLLSPAFKPKKIQEKIPNLSDYRREIFFSCISLLLFALWPYLIITTPWLQEHSLKMQTPFENGKLYFWLAFIPMFFIHDTYFYWIHRFMHHPKMFKYFHLVHHKSTNPSPWAAYSFHPLEGFLEASIFPVLVFTLPLSNIHLMFFFLFQIIYNVYGHLGYELYPKGFQKTWIGRWINTSVAHNMHHQYFKGNYGLYFLFWDRMMGTMHPQYNEKFDEAKH